MLVTLPAGVPLQCSQAYCSLGGLLMVVEIILGKLQHVV